MKNQYFGDINDYYKYGLLRGLIGDGELSLSVCWMLTENDGSKHGNEIGYLHKPFEYRHRDPDIYDALRKAVIDEEKRDVGVIEQSGLLGDVSFHRELLTDDATKRVQYFEEACETFRGADLVFFDPDTGLEIDSTKWGRRKSRCYLYWRELAATFAAGHSVLVYQHFPHEKHDQCVMRKKAQIILHTPTTSVIPFETDDVVFLLLVQPAHEEILRRGVEHIRNRWEPEIRVID